MTLTNPTAEEVERFCQNMQGNLLLAVKRGNLVELAYKQLTQDVESPVYGEAPVEVLVVGAVYQAKFKDRSYL